jgi:hypothetical protein
VGFRFVQLCEEQVSALRLRYQAMFLRNWACPITGKPETRSLLSTAAGALRGFPRDAVVQLVEMSLEPFLDHII